MAEDVNPQDARAFLTNFVPDPKALESMPEPDVLAYHGRVKGFHDKAMNDAVTAATEKAPVFKETWRQHIAGEDKDALKTLERFTDPGAMFKSYNELRTKLSKGELKAHTPFPDKGTPEEQNAWRKDQGIPEKPDGYDLNLGDGLVIGDEDKPWVDMFLAKAHAAHLPPGAVKTTLSTFFGEIREKQNEAIALAEKETMKKAEDTLRETLGTEYRPTMNAIQSFLDAKVSANSTLKTRIMKSIQMEPEFAMLFAGITRELDPFSTLAGGGGGGAKGIIDEWKAIQKMRQEKRADYNRDEKTQARERELISAMQRQGIMDANGNLKT